MTEIVPINGELNVIKHIDNLTFLTLLDLYVLLKTLICHWCPKNFAFFIIVDTRHDKNKEE